MKDVKRWKHLSQKIGYEVDGVTASRMGGMYCEPEGDYVLASDYDAAMADAKGALGEALAEISTLATEIQLKRIEEIATDSLPQMEKRILEVLAKL